MSIVVAAQSRQYHLYRKETDMRKGFDSLCGIVLNELGKHLQNASTGTVSLLHNILEKIADHPINKIADLLPHRFKK